MQIPLNQFEQYIDETILKRGLSYFKNGYVNEPEEISAGEYEAIVEGTEDYTVELKIKNEIITEHVCSCPYDMGPVCKHIVAVLFYMQQDVLELKPKKTANKTNEKPTTKKGKRKTLSEQVNEVLEKITLGELKQFIQKKSEQDPLFRNIFLSFFALQNTNESKELYAKQVKTILKSISDRYGFIYRSQAISVWKQVSELLGYAQKQIENNNFKSAIFICTAVLEEMTKALQFTDDSNGDIGGGIDLSLELLNKIIQEKLPEETRVLLFDYCLSANEQGLFKGWDWHLDMLEIATKILITDKEAERIIQLLDKIQESEYEKNEAQRIKLNIIRKTKGDNEAEKFIEQNLSNPNLRKEAIQNAIKNKAFEKAITISKDGIKQDEKDKPGLAKEWYDWLLKIAQAQNDKEKIIEYARYLFIYNIRNEQDYYKLLKDTVKKKDWNDFVEEIIQDIIKKNRWLDFELITKIFIEEEWWSRLFELIKQNPSLNRIEYYENYLSKDFTNELVLLYKNEIVKHLENNMGRNHYQTACKYLRKMIKLGGRKTAETLVTDFRKQYPQRKALMEELNRI